MTPALALPLAFHLAWLTQTNGRSLPLTLTDELRGVVDVMSNMTSTTLNDLVQLINLVLGKNGKWEWKGGRLRCPYP